MEGHAYDEIRMFNQLFAAIVIIANFGYFLSINMSEFPWLNFLGASAGLIIITLCWLGKRAILFIIGIFGATLFYCIAFSWQLIF